MIVIAGIERDALCHLLQIAAVEHVQHNDGDAQRISRRSYAPEAIDQKITAIALPLKAAVDADH